MIAQATQDFINENLKPAIGRTYSPDGIAEMLVHTYRAPSLEQARQMVADVIAAQQSDAQSTPAPVATELGGIIDLDLDSTVVATVQPTPSVGVTPQPDFKAIAEKMIALGGHVHPVRTGEKALTVPGWQNLATRDLAVAAKWVAEDPHANCAVVGKPDGLWLFDDDEGVLAEYESTHGPINTYRVRSVSGGTHLYFKQNDASRAMGNIGGKDEHGKETWSARVNNRYVIAPGSVAHPNNDPSQPLTQYRVIARCSVTEAPHDFIEFLKGKAGKATATSETPGVSRTEGIITPVAEGGRNNFLTSVGGSLRRAGCEYEQILAVLQRKNEERCSPPLLNAEVEAIARSISHYKDESDSVVFSSAKPNAQLDLSTWRQQFRTVGELQAGDVQMLIKNFLPEGTTFIGALPGEGKTLLALSIAKALTTGEDFLGRTDFDVPKRQPVLYLIPEVGAQAFRMRCEKFHIPDDPNLFLCRTISEGPTLLLDDPLVLEAVRRMRPVVFLDTVLRFNEAEDENAAAQNKALVNQLLELRHAGATSIVGLHHSTKAMRKEGMSLETVLRGTGDLAAMCDAVYGLLRDDKLYANNAGPNEIDVRCVKPRDFDPPAPFRIAASRKAEKPSIIGIAPGIVSNIDQHGDFVVIGGTDHETSNAERLERLVSDDPALKLSELQDITGLSIWAIRQTLSKRGWVKDKGGAKGASHWHRVGVKTDAVKADSSAIDLDADAA